tara:strand:+ start:756 stop:890 length:135 start_codon:yes stop_codon:yes gene_type:complete
MSSKKAMKKMQKLTFQKYKSNFNNNFKPKISKLIKSKITTPGKN